MNNHHSTHGFVIGSVLVAAIEQVPDTVLSSVGKALLFVAAAAASGFAYSAGRWLWSRLVPDDDR